MASQFHPACLAWPLVSDEDLADLARDIGKNGLRHPVVRWRGQVIDGRNRVCACERAGVTPTFTDCDDQLADDDAVWAYTVSVNAKRRHLTRAQLRNLIDARLKAKPEKSNRQIAKELKVADNTVKARRAELESTAQIAQLPKTTGADGKARPAHRPPAAESTAETPQLPRTRGADAKQRPTCRGDPCPAQMPSRPVKLPVLPPRVSGQVFDEEEKLVRAAVENMKQTTQFIRQCEAKYGFGGPSTAALRKAYAELSEAMKGVH